MFIIIGSDGKEYGPVDASGIKSWIEARRANLQTRARRVEETEWKTLGDFPEFADVVAPPPPISVAPPPAPAVDLKTPVPVNVAAYSQEIINRGVKIQIDDCLKRSWEFCKKDYRELFPAAAVSAALRMAVSCVPYIGGILHLFVAGILGGGVIYFFLGKIRGESRKIENIFEGFSRMTLQLLLCPIVSGLLGFAAMLPGLIILAAGCFLISVNPILGGIIAGVGALAALIPAWYLNVAWTFALYLVMDKRFGFWEALEISRRVVTKQWWSVFALGLVLGLIVFAGILCCFVGVLFVLPIVICAMTYAYETLFGDKSAGAAAITPVPEN